MFALLVRASTLWKSSKCAGLMLCALCLCHVDQGVEIWKKLRETKTSVLRTVFPTEPPQGLRGGDCSAALLYLVLANVCYHQVVSKIK